MSEVLRFSASDAMPERTAVLEQQGIPAERAVPPRIEELYTAALDILLERGAPVGVLKEITKAEFEGVYAGEGRNDPDTPVGDIFAQADRLALFAVTLGAPVCREIATRFEANDLALGCMLDSAASVSADKLAERAERHCCDLLSGTDGVGEHTGVLRYSPGYCGWHVSGQRKLFEFLRPERIGMSLRDSFLMEPLKSVSGVILAGPREIHDFNMAYSFCADCETRECRDRISALEAP